MPLSFILVFEFASSLFSNHPYMHILLNIIYCFRGFSVAISGFLTRENFQLEHKELRKVLKAEYQHRAWVFQIKITRSNS